MSIRIMSDVWQNSKQEGTKLLMLLALADFANDAGWAWPSIRTLAQKARIGERQAKRILHELVEEKEIEIRVRGGPYNTNLYMVTCTSPCHADHGVDVTKGVVYTPPDPSLTINDSPLDLDPNTNRSDEGNILLATSRRKGKSRPTKEWLTRFEALIGYKLPNGGLEAKGMTLLYDAGYTWEQVVSCYNAVKQEPFWKNRHVSLMEINKRIGAWLKVNAPKEYAGGFGSVTSTKVYDGL